MLTSRLVSIVSGLKSEYESFEILNLLETAANVAASRASTSAHQYRVDVTKLKNRANNIVSNTSLNRYPPEIVSILRQSKFNYVIPDSVARMILTGFFEDSKDTSISSAELNSILQSARNFAASLNNFLTFALEMRIEKYDLPENSVSFELTLPRSLFSNNFCEFSSKSQFFGDWLTSLVEYSTGTREHPRLVYISTSDPITTIAIARTAAITIISVYNELLDSAIKTVNLVKAIRELKKSGIPNVGEMSETLEATIESCVERAVDNALSRISCQADQNRKNELAIEIKKRSQIITVEIANGARISLSIESNQQISVIIDNEEIEPSITDRKEFVAELLEHQKNAEIQLCNLTAGSEERILIEAPQIRLTTAEKLNETPQRE
jgi:hypothetical protein